MQKKYAALLLLTVIGAVSLLNEYLLISLTDINFGSSLASVNIVLIVWFTGIAAGNYFAGRILLLKNIQKIFFAMLACEALLGLFIFFMPELVRVSGIFFSSVYNPDWNFPVKTLLKYVICVIIFFIPCAVMGMRLPLFFGLNRNKNIFGTGWGLCTLGSCAGVFLAAFYIPGNFAVSAVLKGSAVFSFLTACLVFIFSPRDAAPAENAFKNNFPRKKAYRAAFGLGFLMMFLEIIWIRLFYRYVPNTRYVFSAVIINVLLGSALGSFFYSRIKSVKTGFWGILSLAGLIWLSASSLLAETFFLHLKNFFSALPAVYSLIIIFAAAVPVFFPCFISGLLLPCIYSCFLPGENKTSYTADFLASHTGGHIAGALCCGYIFLPSAGLFLSYAVIGCIIFMVLAVLFFRTGIRMAVLTGGIIAMALFIIPLLPHYRAGQQNIIASISGIDADAEILQKKEAEYRQISLVINRAFISGSDGPEAVMAHKRQGLLPVLFSEATNRALAISFGTGATASSFLDAGFGSVECAEISSASLKVAGFFSHINSKALTKARFRLVIDDGRLYVRKSSSHYDIILSDLYQFQCSSAPLMYTKEFFRDLKKLLAPGGIIVQWLPIRQIPAESLKMILKTFSEIFPGSEVFFLSETGDYLHLGIIASATGRVNFHRAVYNYSVQPEVFEKALLNPGIAGGYYLCRLEDIIGDLHVYPVITADFPIIDKNYISRDFLQDNLSFLMPYYRDACVFEKTAAQSDSLIYRRLFRFLLQALNRNSLSPEKMITELKSFAAGYNISEERLYRDFPHLSYLLGKLYLQEAVRNFNNGNIPPADELLRRIHNTRFSNSHFYRLAGLQAGLRGEFITSQRYFDMALNADNNNSYVYSSRAQIDLINNRKEEALKNIYSALALDGKDRQVLRIALHVFITCDRFDDFSRYLDLYKKYLPQDRAMSDAAAVYLNAKGSNKKIK
ncbi:MAG: hypothetical protein A2096_00910 [Spirochaetes bacterium GWF1_41_5]|nr:MAG: hypothetical protein A2096_00910 [Spirochaetes bacterium GWF1_41_5]HBE02963.1 hypothetical protein [Spirochaetia bacterium]